MVVVAFTNLKRRMCCYIICVIDITYALSGLYTELHVCVYAFHTAPLLLCVRHSSILVYCILPFSHLTLPLLNKAGLQVWVYKHLLLSLSFAHRWYPDPTLALVASWVWHAPHWLAHPNLRSYPPFLYLDRRGKGEKKKRLIAG